MHFYYVVVQSVQSEEDIILGDLLFHDMHTVRTHCFNFELTYSMQYRVGWCAFMAYLLFLGLYDRACLVVYPIMKLEGTEKNAFRW